jgi:addiction module HigA family antidote
MPMFDAAHPGEILREEMGQDITVSRMAQHLGISRVTLSRLLNGQAGVTANMALRLAEAFPKTDARFWMTLQSNYELSRAMRKRRRHIAPIRIAHAA